MVYRTFAEPWGFVDQTVYVKTQHEYNCRPAFRLWRSTPTFEREFHALSAFRILGLNVPNVLAFRRVDGVTELVLQDISEAMDLPSYWKRYPDARVNGVLNELGRMVGVFHRAGWVHGSIGGSHVLIQPGENDRVWLIDLEKARRTRSETRKRKDLERFMRRSPYITRPQLEAFVVGYGSGRGGKRPARNLLEQLQLACRGKH